MNNRIVKIIIIVLAQLVIINTIFASPKERQLQFERLTLENSPDQSLITAIYQDKEGFLWIGTHDGLYKYDGYQFIMYKNRIFDTESISDNYIKTITEDRKGNIWIGTQTNGVCKYNKVKDVFENFRHSDFDNNSLINNRIWAMLEDSRGAIWIGTSGGLDRLDPGTKKFSHYLNDNNSPNNLSNNVVNSIFEDKKNQLWLGTFGNGLVEIDLANLDKDSKPVNKINTYKFAAKGELNVGLNRIKSIIQGKNGNLWLATYGGLIRFDPKTKNYKTFSLNNYKHYIANQNTLLSLVEESNGRIWAGSHSYGLCLFNKASGTFEIFDSASLFGNNISDIYVPSLYIDRTGILWVGTGKGLNKVLPYYQNFLNFSYNFSDTTSLSSNEINSIYQDSEGDIWIGTWGGGLDEFNKKNLKFTRYLYNNKNKNSLPDNTVWTITEDPNKDLLIGTYSGLVKLNKKTGKITRDYLRESRLSHDNVSSILFDKKGDLWVGTYGGGLNRLRKGSKKFIYYKFSPDNKKSVSDNFITTLYQDNKGVLWIGTLAGGLDYFDPLTDSFHCFQYNPQNKFTLSNNNVRCIYEDKLGNFWIGTWGGGLNLFDRKSKKFFHITEKDGLSNNVVFGILEDHSGNLWISTNKGLSKYDVKRKSFINYQTEDGLGSDQFGYGHLKANDGTMYLGENNGLTIFNPNNIKINNHIPPVVITSFKKYNKDINFNEVLSKDKKIILNYDENEFTIEYASLDYTRPTKNYFAHQLLGYDKNWIYSRNIHFAHYTHLSPGVYTFRVKASNNDMVWNNKGVTFVIEIIPPYWDTVWFKTGIIIVLLMSVYVAYKMRVRTIAARNETLERLVKKRTEELESEILIREKTEEALKESEQKLKILNANKDKFFSIISHDLKSPFFTLLGFGSMLESDFDNFSLEEIREIIINMNSLTKRLSDLTENLLQWSMIQTGNITYTPKDVNLGKIVEKPVSLLSINAENKNINIINKVDNELTVNVDINMINSVIQNLIVNAIKFTEPGGTITISSRRVDSFAELSVIDTGIGIKNDKIEKLFKIEEQTSTKGTREEPGTGLGLILCKEFIEKNGGQIFVESIENKGTTFKITMPITK